MRKMGDLSSSGLPRRQSVFQQDRFARARPLGTLILAVFIAALSGCASTLAPHNDPLDAVPSEGYRIGMNRQPRQLDDVVLGLSLSGGGARAAALSYGVMEELSKTKVVVDGKPVRMLDLVEHISAVSGGSYPAAYYGLFGDRLFEDFETRFLKRDVQGEIVHEIFSLRNLIRLTSPYFGRSDVTADLLDQVLFEKKTFADLEQAVQKGGRPFIVINATDIALTSRFEFTQDQFDLLCSDLGSYRISRAVAASSAVPVVFSPITLRNYTGRCDLQKFERLANSDISRDDSIRRYALVADLRTYLDPKREYVHLLDGGLSDNLGLRFMLDRLTLLSAKQVSEGYERRCTRHIVQIVVNAQARSRFPDLDRLAEVPTLRAVAFAVANTTDRYSVETLAYAKAVLADVAATLAAKQRGRGCKDDGYVQANLVEITFDSLSDSEREYFNALPTNFNLPAAAVDRLRETGARLLRSSPGYQQLLKDLSATR